MISESGIYNQKFIDFGGFDKSSEAVLLHSTSLSRLYRISLHGRHFLFKTPASDDSLSLAMIRREYEISAGCAHPNIVNVLAFCETSPVGAGILMEYIDGRTLDIFLTENPSAACRSKIFGEMLSAVAYLHQRGVIHNDLKPANLLVTNNGNTLKLIDFGLSDTDTHYLYHTLGCSPEYASPELRSRSEVIDVRSDIYSVGLMMRLIFQRRYSFISSRCTQTDPSKRYSDIEALQNAWNRRNLVWKIVAGMLLLAVLSAAIVLLYMHQQRIQSETEASVQYIERMKRKVEAESMKADSTQSILDKVRTDAEFLRKERDQRLLEENERAAQCSLLSQKVVTYLEKAYRLSADSLSKVPYYNFGNNYLFHFNRMHDIYYHKEILPIADEQVRRHVKEVFSLRHYELFKVLVEKHAAMPSVWSDTSLSSEEKTYYEKLLMDGLPYKPYTGK